MSQQIWHNAICFWVVGLVFPNQGQGHTERSRSVSQSFCILLIFCKWHFSQPLEFQNVTFSHQNMVDIVHIWTSILPVNLRKFTPEQDFYIIITLVTYFNRLLEIQFVVQKNIFGLVKGNQKLKFHMSGFMCASKVQANQFCAHTSKHRQGKLWLSYLNLISNQFYWVFFFFTFFCSITLRTSILMQTEPCCIPI